MDVAVACLDRGIYGWSWALDMELRGVLDQNGFVFDFSHAKSQGKEVVKEVADHKLIVPILCPGVRLFTLGNERQLKLQAKNGDTWAYSCPADAITEVPEPEITTAAVERLLARRMLEVFPKNITGVTITLRDEALAEGDLTYCYTHGLPQHAGLCQRLFHGHRSRLEVWVGAKRQKDLEAVLHRDFFLGGSLHIASRSQLTDAARRESIPLANEPGRAAAAGPAGLTLSYAGSRGNYHGQVPRSRLKILDHETSIECIAQSAYEFLLNGFPALSRQDLRVAVFEGIDKGAMAGGRQDASDLAEGSG